MKTIMDALERRSTLTRLLEAAKDMMNPHTCFFLAGGEWTLPLDATLAEPLLLTMVEGWTKELHALEEKLNNAVAILEAS